MEGAVETSGALAVDGEALSDCIAACLTCAEACMACADACLEDEVEQLRRCIRLDLDCAEVCDATAHILSRQLQAEPEVRRRQLELLSYVSGLCAEECARHEATNDACRACNEACLRCQESCGRLLRQMGAEAAAAPTAH